jgi:hypothetical protein
MARTARKEREQTGSAGLGIPTIDKIGRDASEVGMGIIVVLAALIGIWGIACLVGGLVNSGGIADLLGGYISAVTGR